MGSKEDQRLIARVARMYYESGIRQNEIASQLGLSQAAVSRLLSQGEKSGIIKVVVNIPRGVFTEIEEELVEKYGLKDAVVADCSLSADGKGLAREIGYTAARYLESILRPNDVIGVSSWSTYLLEMANAMTPISRRSGIQVIQILGGLGNAQSQSHSTHLTSHLSEIVNGTPYFLPVPAVVKSTDIYNSLITDKTIQDIFARFPSVNTALVGIGNMNPSSLLAASGNVLSEADSRTLQKRGAVGDILLRFYDRKGQEIDATSLTNPVISMSLEQLKKVERAIAIAGGDEKFDAIHSALQGKLVNILITDQFTAKRLLESPS